MTIWVGLAYIIVIECSSGITWRSLRR